MCGLENVATFIRERNLFVKNRRRAFFLLLSLAPNNKYVSKFFIRDKIEEAILKGLFPEDISQKLDNGYLEDIRTDFYCLASKGFVERIDMSQSSQTCFERFCKSRVVGSYFLAPHRRTQIFQRLTCAGKKRLREIMNGQA